MTLHSIRTSLRALARPVLAAGLLVLLSSVFFQAEAQNRRRRGQTTFSQAVEYIPDTTKPVLSDSILAIRDSIARADSLFKIDSTALQRQSSLDSPAFSEAKDSVVEVFSDGQRKIFYYGDVTVTYGNMKLTADYMEYDMKTGTVFARGTYDSLTGEWKGQPEMSEGQSTYKMEELRYNFNSRKARITNMITQQDEGLLQGTDIKMMADKSININDGRYQVCDLDDPHYYLHLTLAKVITQPSQKTVFGPAWPVIEGVPLPIAIPFGFVPKRPSRATGLLMPTFGEENARGFYLRDAGMYFVLGDHFDLSVTGDYYTLGSWGIDINSRYKVNYKFSGNFSMTYSNDQTGERGSTDFFQTRNFAVRWSHSQDTKFMPGTTFSASVNFSSPSNSRYNSRSLDEAIQSQASSSISFAKNWSGKVNLSVNVLHSQNSRDSSYTFSLPNISLSVTRFYPFKSKNRIGKERIYEKISFAYNTSLQNKISFKASEFMQDGFTDKFQNGMTHNFQIGLPNFTLFKYFQLTPSVSYGMNMFFRKSEYVYNEETGKVEQVWGRQFGTLGMTHNYSGGLSMSTRLYGMFNFGRTSRVQAIRHVISPSLSLSLSPDKATHFNGWRTLTYTDASGKEQTYDYNIYAGQMNSVPGKGKSATLSVSIGNNLEAKVRDLRDTTGKGVKKIKLIDQLSINTGFNFLADSMKMNNVGVSMSTSIFGKLGLSGNANFDPYALDERGRRYNQFNFVKNGLSHALRMTGASFSLSYSISGKGTYNGNDGSKQDGSGATTPNTAEYYRRIYYHPITGEYIPGGWVYYTNPNVPWSASFNYSFSYTPTWQYSNGQLIKKKRFQQTLGANGNVRLSPKMNMTISSGFDFVAMKMTSTQLSFSYDLHCFNISVSYIPSGKWQNWSFRIAANASALADLLRYKKSTSYWDR
ncbi:MAG: LPS-assembly protein LptD [Bacteroidales bacterium]|nr:LPS-assembly protein LptD [Bacteroidales bacterium]